MKYIPITTSCKRANTHNAEQGMAMLLVLGIVAATTLLAVHMMAIGETIARESAVNAMTSRLRFQVESAADEAFWMHLTDRRLFSNRNLGSDTEDRDNYTDMDAWMLDGREHIIEDDCFAYLNDAIKALSISSIKNLKENFDEDDTDAIERANAFSDVYEDYVDDNDLLSLNGQEKDDYAQAGFPTLPRNGAMQFIAELYWLPGWKEVITSDITIIPPKGITIGNASNSNSRNRNASSNSSSSKPNFFTCSDETIRLQLQKNALQISDKTIEDVIEARKLWRENNTPIEDSLDGEIMITLKNVFSFTESGYAEITAVAFAYDGALRAVRTVTREANSSSQTFHSDSKKQTLSIWEIRNY